MFLYAALLPLAALRAYLKPSRRSLELLYGLLLLALSFEYQKHGVPVVRATADYLFEVHYELRWLSHLLLVGIAPIAGHIIGAVLVLLSLRPRLRMLRLHLDRLSGK